MARAVALALHARALGRALLPEGPRERRGGGLRAWALLGRGFGARAPPRLCRAFANTTSTGSTYLGSQSAPPLAVPTPLLNKWLRHRMP
jgi:hypothetical protein